MQRDSVEVYIRQQKTTFFVPVSKSQSNGDLMSDLWKLSAEIRSAVLLIDENYTLSLMGELGDETIITFDFPKKAETDVWSNWDHRIPPNIWDYKITYQFRAKDEEEAQARAWKKLENIAALLSFVSSAPVTIKSHGSITNAPEEPIVGNQYTTISLTFDQAWEEKIQPVLESPDIEYLTKIIVPDNLIHEGEERIFRSMRWLQNSHFASSPVEEFMSLMLAFEAISHLITPAGPHYWHCSRCDEDILSCPNCGESTEWAGSGKIGMAHFVIDILGWKKTDWRRIWKLRNLVFHGRHDLTSEKQQSIVSLLPKLEEAVVNALRYLLRVPKQAPPRSLRQRGRFFGAKLNIKWTKNDGD